MGLDKAVNIFMQEVENSSLTFLSEIIDIALDPVILIVVSVLIAAIFFIKNKKREGVFFISIMGIAAILIKGFKFFFNRTRPLNAILEEASPSFPSGHATIAVVFFGLLAFLILEIIKKKKNLHCTKISIIFAAILASIISGFTRIYLRVHWLTDVLAGFLLGGIILISGIIFYKKH
ncbi:phosphatase PAP2 family protein [Candidatus Pacearchaeota archaeon]|nr:phosphatase PAP2 family protein [Candidatus Pacearchaeota archaeon]